MYKNCISYNFFIGNLFLRVYGRIEQLQLLQCTFLCCNCFLFLIDLKFTEEALDNATTVKTLSDNLA